MAEARSGVRRTATLPHGEANFLPRGRVRRALLGPSKGSTCASLGANHGVNAPFASILRLREKNRGSSFINCIIISSTIPARKALQRTHTRVPVLGYRGRRSLP